MPSKLRNRLKSETAAKLVFCYRMLRMQCTSDARNTGREMKQTADDDDDSDEFLSDSDSIDGSQCETLITSTPRSTMTWSLSATAAVTLIR